MLAMLVAAEDKNKKIPARNAMFLSSAVIRDFLTSGLNLMIRNNDMYT